MTKILSAAILVGLGSLLSVQARAAVFHDAITFAEVLVRNIKAGAHEVVEKAHFVKTEAQNATLLVQELQQLQIALNNAKRASPKLWDKSQSIFDNIVNATDQVDTLANATKSVKDALTRAGCTNGVFDGVSGRKLTERTPVQITATTAANETLLTAREKEQLQNRCKRLAILATNLASNKDNALDGSKEAEERAALIRSGKAPGENAILDEILAAISKANAAAMEANQAVTLRTQAELELELAEAAQRKSMHDRLMKAPSSNSKMKARNPALTIDPKNY